MSARTVTITVQETRTVTEQYLVSMPFRLWPSDFRDQLDSRDLRRLQADLFPTHLAASLAFNRYDMMLQATAEWFSQNNQNQYPSFITRFGGFFIVYLIHTMTYQLVSYPTQYQYLRILLEYAVKTGMKRAWGDGLFFTFQSPRPFNSISQIFLKFFQISLPYSKYPLINYQLIAIYNLENATQENNLDCDLRSQRFMIYLLHQTTRRRATFLL